MKFDLSCYFKHSLLSWTPTILNSVIFFSSVGCSRSRGAVEQTSRKHAILLCVSECVQFFSGTFFKWVDKPPCPWCGSLTFPVGVVPPTPEEALWGAGNVESYKCQNCGKTTRFPRYNHPAKLLGKGAEY